MAVLITTSGTPLEADTVCATKITHFSGDIVPIYSYVRIYCIKGGLCVSFKVFERTPSSHFAIKLAHGADLPSLFIDFFADECTAVISNGTERKEDVKVIFEPISGDDNQGYFWGAEFTLSAGVLKAVDITAKPGELLLANFFVYTDHSNGIGSAFKNADPPHLSQDYGDLLIVNY